MAMSMKPPLSLTPEKTLTFPHCFAVGFTNCR
jgi:hypothetical protein